MAQGKGFTQEERQTIIQSLKPFLEMGFSRNKSCHLIGLPPQTLSNWVQEDESLGMKLTSWENLNNALALANIHQALQNEKILATEKGDTRVDNSWKLVSKLEEGYRDKIEQDITSKGESITPLLVKFLDESNNGDTKGV